MESQPIVVIARQIRPFLSKAIADMTRAQDLEKDVDVLLSRSEDEDIGDALLNRLTEEREVQLWLTSFWILDDGTRGDDDVNPSLDGAGLAGDPGMVSSRKYICPVFGCQFEFPVIKMGMKIPKCLVHNVDLIERSS